MTPIKKEITDLINRLQERNPGEREGFIIIGNDRVDKSFYVGATFGQDFMVASVRRKKGKNRELIERITDLADNFLEALGINPDASDLPTTSCNQPTVKANTQCQD